VRHYGIDEVEPNEHFSAALFFELYKCARRECEQSGKNLIIVGGTGFYLYTLINGLSELPKISEEATIKASKELENRESAFEKLAILDQTFASKISPNDSYRIQKAFEIYYQTGLAPSEAFKTGEKNALCPDITVFEIESQRSELRAKIRLRTQKMFDDGLVDEVKMLENRYGREPKSMKSIGISEVLEFLDGKISADEASELISIHTGQLAKRQETFNRSKFLNSIKLPISKLRNELESFLKN
jgi:tRNA dimethylallyltransferase